MIIPPEHPGYGEIGEPQSVYPPQPRQKQKPKESELDIPPEVTNILEGEKKYAVLNPDGEQLYHCFEVSSCYYRINFSSQRPYVLHVQDNDDGDALKIIRAHRCSSLGQWISCASCCLDEIEVMGPDETTIGFVRQIYAGCGTCFLLLDVDNNPVIRIDGPGYCSCILPGDDQTYNIKMVDGDVRVGVISKIWSGLQKKSFPEPENFGAKFPLDMDIYHKCLILAAVFLIVSRVAFFNCYWNANTILLLSAFRPISAVQAKSQSVDTSNRSMVDLALQLVREPLPPEGQVVHQSGRVEYCPDQIRSFYQTNGFPIPLFGLDGMSNEDDSKKIVKKYDCITGDLEPIHLAKFLSTISDEYRKAGRQLSSIYLGSAESIIHGYYSEWSQEYWTVRRSMQFAPHLVDVVNQFRSTHLNSTDLLDRTLAPTTDAKPSWLHFSWPIGPPIGGAYLGVHWRCGDFMSQLVGGDVETRTPNVSVLAGQIREALGRADALQNNSTLTKVFLATDAGDQAKSELRTLLQPDGIELVYFQTQSPVDQQRRLSPGELAIVDQIICSLASFFIGTNPSTFTFRIIEERAIMGFRALTSCNTLCPTGHAQLYNPDGDRFKQQQTDSCDPLTNWPVIYEPAFTVYSNGDDDSNHFVQTREEL